MENNKCFNCFDKGHRKATYQNKVRCINCALKKRASVNNGVNVVSNHNHNGINGGPNLRTEKTSTLPIKELQQDHIQTTTTKTEAHAAKNSKKQSKMDLSDWEIMELIHPDHVEIGRAEDMEVFINPREELLPPNLFLNRTAVVLTGPNQNDRFLAHRIATRFASYFRMQLRDFKVRKTHPTVGDYLAIFPNNPMMKEAAQVCVFALGPDVVVQLTEWTKETGMIYDPSSNLARVKLHGVPLQNWNTDDVASIVSGFGELQRMALFAENENYEFIHAPVDYRRPIRVPRHVKAQAKSYSATVDVELDGWIHTSDFDSHVRREINRGD